MGRGGLVVDPTFGFAMQQGIHFEPNSWDGSDLFMSTELSGWFFVLQPVREAFERERVRNVEWTPITAVQTELDR